MKKLLKKLILRLLALALGFFVVTFTVYFFNVDMKLTALIEHFMLKNYDRIERKTYL